MFFLHYYVPIHSINTPHMLYASHLYNATDNAMMLYYPSLALILSFAVYLFLAGRSPVLIVYTSQKTVLHPADMRHPLFRML